MSNPETATSTIQSIRQPEASMLPKQVVYDIAENIARQLDFQLGGDILESLAKLGGRVRYREFSALGKSDSGSLTINGTGDFDVFVATNTSPTRDRFTIAHEIGHYVLHYLWPQSNGEILQRMEATRYGSDRAEWEANWFAAAFLMPESTFRSEYDVHKGDINELSKRFSVSPMAAEIRARGLGLC